MIGETLGSYRVVQKIGTGGMGVVYLAVHPLLGRKAVIKLLLPQYSNNPQVVTRFFHEARASALIGHPGIIDIFDFGHSPSGDAYLVMEYLEGESLQARMKREKVMSPPVAVAITRQVTSALAAAHQKGIVHRDLKPDNLFLLPDRDSGPGFRVKVLDFGIAKLAREAMAEAVATNAGATIGTPKYMAPEQCLDAAAVDARADLYSLGCIIFEMICGRPPFRADTYAEMLAQHIATPPPAPSALMNGVAPELEAVILRALEKDLSRRYQTMEQMAVDLDRLAAPGLLAADKPAAIAHREPTDALPEVTPVPLVRTPPVARTPGPVVPTPPPAGLSAQQTVVAKRSAVAAAPPEPGPAPPTPVPSPPQMSTPPPSSQAVAALTETSTTLGGAASEIRHGQPAPPPPRRAILPAAAVGVVLGLAGVAVAIVVVKDDEPQPPAPRVEALAATGAEPEPSPGPSPSASPVPTSPMVTLRSESDPAGADVFSAGDGVRVGRTPVVQRLPKGDREASFILRRSGFRDARVSIPLSRDGIGYVQLEKSSKKKGKSGASSATNKTKPINDGALDPFGE